MVGFLPKKRALATVYGIRMYIYIRYFKWVFYGILIYVDIF